jgi:hypothetical protein
MLNQKARGSFSRIILFTILLSISIVGSVAARARTLPSPVMTTPGQTSAVYTIKEAGLQFEVPKGWKVEKQENGNVVLSVEDGAVTITFLVEDDYQGVVTGMKSGLKTKVADFKSDGESKQDTHNGMVHISETGTGSIKDAPVIWSIDVLKATRPVTILTFGVAKIMEAHGDDYAAIVNSLKKI